MEAAAAQASSSASPSPSFSSSSASPPTKHEQPFFLPRRTPRPLTDADHPHHPTTSSLSLPSSSSSSSSSSRASEELTHWKADQDEQKQEDDLDSPSTPTSPIPFTAKPPPPPVVRAPAKKGGAGAAGWVRPVQTSRMVEVFRDDIFSVIFSFFDGHTVALLSSVSQAWSALLQDPIIWQSCALQYWGDHRHSLSILPRYGDSWKRMVCERPHPRFDGIYVLETKSTHTRSTAHSSALSTSR